MEVPLRQTAQHPRPWPTHGLPSLLGPPQIVNFSRRAPSWGLDFWFKNCEVSPPSNAKALWSFSAPSPPALSCHDPAALPIRADASSFIHIDCMSPSRCPLHCKNSTNRANMICSLGCTWANFFTTTLLYKLLSNDGQVSEVVFTSEATYTLRHLLFQSWQLCPTFREYGVFPANHISKRENGLISLLSS